MINDLVALIVDKDPTAGEELKKTLNQSINCADIQFSSSLLGAVEVLRDNLVNVCFVSERFRSAEIQEYFNDLHKLENMRYCVFVQVRDASDEELNRGMPDMPGFEAVISKWGTKEDKKRIENVISKNQRNIEIARRIPEISSAVTHLLNHVDYVAKDRKRRRKTKYNTPASGLIAAYAAFAEELRDKYYTVLREHASNSPAFDNENTKLPKALADMKLPCLAEDGYSGVSWRVNEKITRKLKTTL